MVRLPAAVPGALARREARIADLGCGDGLVALRLARMGAIANRERGSAFVIPMTRPGASTPEC